MVRNETRRWFGVLTGALALTGMAGCPGDPNPPLAGDGCLACHQGIETAHEPLGANACTPCHGGDPKSTSKEGAHVPVPDNWAEIRGDGLPPSPHGFIKDFAPDQLDALDPAYVRFINPGDIRAVPETCGVCHPDQARTVPRSIMTTNAGHYYPTLHLAGLQDDRLANYGSYAATDPDCDPNVPGTVCDLITLVPPDAASVQQTVTAGDPAAIEEMAYEHYLAKNCNTCHHAGYPRNDSPGLFRSTGCTGCHMVYDKLGVYTGDDPTIPKGQPVHPARHEITRAIPTQQCATCHFQGGRIGLAFQGIREGGFKDAPPNAVPINETLYGHAPGYYFTDEDSTNDVDETPPDLHYAAGMHCADCHVGSDVHGDGRLYSSAKQQVDLRCEDCHGTVREPVRPGADGLFRTRGGRALKQLRLEGDQVILTGVVDGADHVVTQPADQLAEGGGASAAMHAAMGPDGEGWSHTDSLTCDTCHTSYNLQCIGCHVSYDLRLDQVDYQTGTVTPGLTRGSRTFFDLDGVLLGTAPDGRVQTVMASQQVQLAVVGAEAYGSGDGEVLLGERPEEGGSLVGEFRHRDGLEANNGFAPFFQHTTSRKPRGCDTCHRTADSPEEETRIRGVYGFGTGEFMLPAPGGGEVDGMQFLDAEGNPTTTWAHEGTGPVSPEVFQRAYDVVLD